MVCQSYNNTLAQYSFHRVLDWRTGRFVADAKDVSQW